MGPNPESVAQPITVEDPPVDTSDYISSADARIQRMTMLLHGPDKKRVRSFFEVYAPEQLECDVCCKSCDDHENWCHYAELAVALTYDAASNPQIDDYRYCITDIESILQELRQEVKATYESVCRRSHSKTIRWVSQYANRLQEVCSRIEKKIGQFNRSLEDRRQTFTVNVPDFETLEVPSATSEDIEFE